METSPTSVTSKFVRFFQGVSPDASISVVCGTLWK